jgi:DNA-binding HxlR family transcriptional regulator
MNLEDKNKTCQYKLMASRDALDVIQGKWRLPIIISLTYGNKRFGEIRRDIADISPKMLSQELKVLESYKLVSRTLHDSMPVNVEYALTPLGASLHNLLSELLDWGLHFRESLIVSPKES